MLFMRSWRTLPGWRNNPGRRAWQSQQRKPHMWQMWMMTLIGSWLSTTRWVSSLSGLATAGTTAAQHHLSSGGACRWPLSARHVPLMDVDEVMSGPVEASSGSINGVQQSAVIHLHRLHKPVEVFQHRTVPDRSCADGSGPCCDPLTSSAAASTVLSDCLLLPKIAGGFPASHGALHEARVVLAHHVSECVCSQACV
jgi:hypothetical protein